MLLETGLKPLSVVENINTKPYPSSDLVGWSTNYGTGGAGTRSYETNGVMGLPFYRSTWTAASTDIARGAARYIGPGALIPGRTYTVSAYTRVSRVQGLGIVALPADANGSGVATITGVVSRHSSNVWTWDSLTFVAPAGSTGMDIRFYASNASSDGSAWAVGDMLDVTAVMLTEGPPVPYFDGNSPGASWSGAQGSSKSSTPALMGIYPTSRLAEMGSVLLSSGTTGGTSPIESGTVSPNTPMTMYAAHIAGVAAARGQFLSGTTSVLAVGRNTAGSGWFVLGQNSSGSAVAPAVTRSTGPNVICGTREQNVLYIHSLAGNQITGPSAVTNWPKSTFIDGFQSSSDVRFTEVWSGIHPVDIRYARMAQIRTLYGINI